MKTKFIFCLCWLASISSCAQGKKVVKNQSNQGKQVITINGNKLVMVSTDTHGNKKVMSMSMSQSGANAGNVYMFDCNDSTLASSINTLSKLSDLQENNLWVKLNERSLLLDSTAKRGNVYMFNYNDSTGTSIKALSKLNDLQEKNIWVKLTDLSSLLDSTLKLSQFELPKLSKLPVLQSEEMPEYQGGMSAMMAFITDNMHYPEDAKKAEKEGRVLCSFIITKEGKVTDVHVVQSSGTRSLDDEAIRIVSLMPDWKPGKNKGEPVSVLFSVPVLFSLK